MPIRQQLCTIFVAPPNDWLEAEMSAAKATRRSRSSAAFIFFASEADSSYISGEVLTVNGADPNAA